MTNTYFEGVKHSFTAPVDFTVEKGLTKSDSTMGTVGNFLAGHSAAPLVAFVAAGDVFAHIAYLARDAFKAGYHVTLGTTRAALNVVPFVDLTSYVTEGHMSTSKDFAILAVKDLFHSVISIVVIPVALLTPFYAAQLMHKMGAHNNQYFQILGNYEELDTTAEAILNTVSTLKSEEEIAAKTKALSDLLGQCIELEEVLKDAYAFIRKNDLLTSERENAIAGKVILAAEVLEKRHEELKAQ